MVILLFYSDPTLHPFALHDTVSPLGIRVEPRWKYPVIWDDTIKTLRPSTLTSQHPVLKLRILGSSSLFSNFSNPHHGSAIWLAAC